MTGKDRVKFLERLSVADLEALPAGHSKLSVYTNEKGGKSNFTFEVQK